MRLKTLQNLIDQYYKREVYTMKKQLLTIVAALALTTSAYAGTVGVGITGSLFNVETDATETTTAGTVGGGAANTNSKTIKNNGLNAASFYAEYTFDGFYGTTLGVDYTPGSADLRDTDLSRVETPASGENSGTSTTYKANGEVENLMLNCNGVISLLSLKFVNIAGVSEERIYSDFRYSPNRNIDRGFLFPPPGGIFEIRYPDITKKISTPNHPP